jgi:hypothetical protein
VDDPSAAAAPFAGSVLLLPACLMLLPPLLLAADPLPEVLPVPACGSCRNMILILAARAASCADIQHTVREMMMVQAWFMCLHANSH